VNIGAYVEQRHNGRHDGATVRGPARQIGKKRSLSGVVGIGGVLEPMQAGHTIIEDNCFIGARSEVVEGCIRARKALFWGWGGLYRASRTKISGRETRRSLLLAKSPQGPVVGQGPCVQKNGCTSMCAVIVRGGPPPPPRRGRENTLENLASTSLLRRTREPFSQICEFTLLKQRFMENLK